MITSTYKEEHESFVSNLSGSSAECVVLCLAHVPAYILLTKMIQGFSAPRVLLDFMGLGLPLMLTMTVFSEYTVASMCFLLVMYAATYKIRAGSFSFRSTFPPSPEKELYGRTSYLTLSKGITDNSPYPKLPIFALKIDWHRRHSSLHLHCNFGRRLSHISQILWQNRNVWRVSDGLWSRVIHGFHCLHFEVRQRGGYRGFSRGLFNKAIRRASSWCQSSH